MHKQRSDTLGLACHRTAALLETAPVGLEILLHSAVRLSTRLISAHVVEPEESADTDTA
jgi:hypothetical protein